MDYPERFSDLPEYAFPRLRRLLDAHAPGGSPIVMSVGEPKHPFPEEAVEALAAHSGEFAIYPPNDGAPELLNAIAGWIGRRYGVAIDPEREVMALNGSREGLFNAALALCPEEKSGARPAILMPNPFYQVYAAAALAAKAEPVYVPAVAETGFLPDYSALPAEILDRVAIVYLCSPANPQGAVASEGYWRALIALAEKHDFRIFADECYSEIYRETAPPGALQVARGMAADSERVAIFHSLSKRSNMPGLRSGFVVGGPESVSRIRQLRAYAGAPIPLPLQRVSERLWADESHVERNRALYSEKYRMADTFFNGVRGYIPPEAGLFLWLPVENGEAATLKLWTETGVRALPGAYLGRDTETGNPGAGHIRVAMVAPIDELQPALSRIRECIYR